MKRRLLSLFLIFICAFSLLPGGEAFALEETPGGSALQIVSEGGEKNDEYLAVSKLISGTDAENVFDITLRVVTRTKIEELYGIKDTAVVIVMDITLLILSDFFVLLESMIHSLLELDNHRLVAFPPQFIITASQVLYHYSHHL